MVTDNRQDAVLELQGIDYSYCDKWFWAEKRPLHAWSVEQAREAHESGHTYVAVARAGEKPVAVVTVTIDYIDVTWLDAHLRQCTSCEYTLIEDGRLFLLSVTVRQFEGDGDRVLGGTYTRFYEDGRMVTRHADYSGPVPKEEDEPGTCDPAAHYIPYPKFGEYRGLLGHPACPRCQ